MKLFLSWKSLPCSGENGTLVSQGNVPHLVCRYSAEAAIVGLCTRQRFLLSLYNHCQCSSFPTDSVCWALKYLLSGRGGTPPCFISFSRLEKHLKTGDGFKKRAYHERRVLIVLFLPSWGALPKGRILELVDFLSPSAWQFCHFYQHSLTYFC